MKELASMPFPPSVHPSIHPSIFLFLSADLCVFVYLAIFLSMCPSNHPSIQPSNYQSINLSVSLSFYLSTFCLSAFPIYLPDLSGLFVDQSVYLHIYQSAALRAVAAGAEKLLATFSEKPGSTTIDSETNERAHGRRLANESPLPLSITYSG